MSRLYVDSNILENVESLKKEQEDFIKSVNDHIENKYKGEDSETVYSLFNPKQIDLLQNFFKGFSVEMYKELNGTVDLQIQEKSQKVKEKINRIAEFMGPIDLKDWVYDGMVDSGKNAGLKCDLCPRPVRYAHFAVNKKTSECLRFGCNCAADFFNMDKSSLASMRTIQAQTLKDIKIIACIVENNEFEKYYKYMCGHVGEIYLKQGEQGLVELTTFMVKWNKDKTLKGDEEKDEYLIVFGDGTKDVKSLNWIKENIVSCLNADLSGKLYDNLKDRPIVPKQVKDSEKTQLNTAGYIKYALKFLDVGLPIPLSLVKKLNSIINKVTHQHHPDYIKYAQELLISHNFEKSSLLTKAFTDFIINYLASTLKVEKRDEEMLFWKIRGQMTFYNTVRTWESAMVKLLAMKDLKSLVSKGLITEEELATFDGRGAVMNRKQMMEYIDKCLKLFVSKKEVVKVPENVIDGYSKYMLKDVDIKIELTKDEKGYSFSTGNIPSVIGIYYRVMEYSYRKLIRDSILSVFEFLRIAKFLDNDEDTMRYLCLLDTGSVGLKHKCFENLGYNVITDTNGLKDYLKKVKIDEDLYNELFAKYKDKMEPLRESLQSLYNDLDEIVRFVKKPYRIEPDKKIDLKTDYEDIVEKKEKGYKDYFLEYCDLLVSKRGNKKVQNLTHQQNLGALVPFKQLNPYGDIFKDIQDSILNKVQKEEEKKVYREFNLGVLKEELEILTSADNLDDFILAYIYLWGKEKYMYCPYIVKNNSCSLSTGLSKNKVELEQTVNSKVVEKCKSEYRNYFEGLFEALKEFSNKLVEDKMTFKYYYSLLKKDNLNDSKEVEKKIDKAASVYEYSQILIDNLRIKTYYTPSYLDIRKFLNQMSVYEGFDLYLNTVFLEIISEEIVDEEKKKEQESKGKKDIVDKIKVILDEHIKFFEVDIAEARKKKGYYKKSDVSVRQLEAFKTVKFEKGYEIISRFIAELEERQDLSDGVSELIAKGQNISAVNYGENKLISEGLRVELYNKKLIYNHFDVTYQILKDLDYIDLNMFSFDDLNTLYNILSVYYLLESNVRKIKEILETYNGLTFDFDKEVSKIPTPVQIDIKNVVDKNTDKADSTGYTGVEKAEKVLNHADFITLPSYLQSIVKSVVKYKRCTGGEKGQLAYVNDAFKRLGLGNPDILPVKKEEKVVSEVSSKDDKENKDNTDTSNVVIDPNALSPDEEKEAVELAKTLKNHSDFNTLLWMRNIIITVVKREKCSVKQLRILNQAKDKLGI